MKRLLGMLLLLGALAAQAAERVLEFHSDIRIDAKGTLTVTETIAVQTEGREIRRGILRDFPTDYRDRYGNKVTVPLEVLGVTRDGRPERFALERLGNGTRIRIGNANVILPHGRHDYRIAYRTARQIGFFEGHDELYWNVNGTGWSFAFERISAEVTLPAGVPAAQVMLEAYTGPQGARGRNYEAEARDSGAVFRSTRGFAPREGMTIVVAFPKGIVVQPSWTDRAGEFLRDNVSVAAGLGGYLFLTVFLLACWWRVGRDPRSGPAFPRYEAPPGLGPAGVRYIDRMGYDDRCFAAALLGLGSRGCVKIRPREYSAYEIEQTGTAAQLNPGEDTLVKEMFPNAGAPFKFGVVHDSKVQAVRGSFAAALEQHFGGKNFYSINMWVSVVGVLIAVGVCIAMVVIEAPLWVTLVTMLAMLATIMFFAWTLLPAYSVQARKLQDEIDGLRQYLSVAEKDDLARMNAPPQTKEEFSRFLPYAFALDVEKTWANRFAAVLGAAAVAAAVQDYYQSDSGSSDSGNIGGLTDSLSGLGETISAASTPPGSSSGSSGSGGGGGGGSSGGGSSGGGGGGGGGSGW